MRLLARTSVISAYIAGLIYATLVVSPQPNPEPNPELLRTIAACWAMGGETMVVNLLGNLALLAPLGIIGPWFWGAAKRWELPGVLIAGFVLSVSIEATQYACGHRMADVDDVLLNTIGAGLGWGLVRGVDSVCRAGTEGAVWLVGGKPARMGMGVRPSTQAIADR
ncbi:VanZ family protein [Tautonia sp. JC769]|uniref:VanZ family protein n=1 Tax=Tautonia sp. JC769 TaxID=3232135 RepID=UPI00345AE23A